MTEQRTFTMLIEVSEDIRTRLELVKTIIRIHRPGVGAVTWTHAVEWLANTVPVADLLADLCKSEITQAPKGN